MNVEEMLREGYALYGAGRAAEAMGVGEAVIREAPGNAGAMQLVALVHSDAGRHEAALEWGRRCVEAAPGVVSFRNTLGALFERAGRLAEAAAEYRHAMNARPDYVLACNNLGSVLLRLGRGDEAVEAFGQATAVAPADVNTRFNLGTALAAVGRTAEAEACYRAVAGADPRHVGALVNLGVICQEAGRLTEAEAYQRRAVEVAPRLFEAAYALGVTLRRLGRPEEALDWSRAAVEARPGNAEACMALADALRVAGRADEAIVWYRRATELRPGWPDPWCNLSGTLVEVDRTGEAGEAAGRALGLDPSCAAAMANLAAARLAGGLVGEAVELLRRSLDVAPADASARSTLLLPLQYVPGTDPVRLYQEHVEWGRRFGRGQDRRRRATDEGRRLRVGYMSPDFCRHPIASFVAPILAGHDRRVVEVCCYADERRRDDVTDALRRTADRWTGITGMSDEAVAEAIARDEVDVLVDLAGHTRGGRPGVMALRPAPVQVTYLGYCGTTGLREVDYRLTDGLADPAGEERYYTERLVRLAGCFCCYAPAAESPGVSALPAAARGHVTFGSLHGLAKVNAAVLDVWAEVLRRTPGSRLLVHRHTIGAEERRRLTGALASRGIDESRVEARGTTPGGGGRSHLLTYHEVDVALDVFPFSGHTTACEAMWMGVPTVTLLGERHAGRMVGSVLNAAGMERFIARTTDQYVAIAAAAGDLPGLAELRKGMRERVRASRLCDGTAFCRDLERAYREMWAERVGGKVA